MFQEPAKKIAASMFSYSGDELGALAGAKNYHRWILSYFAPYVGRKVVEVGAGIGTFSQLLLDFTKVSELTAMEPADNLFPVLEQRFANERRVKAVKGHLEDFVGSFAVDSLVLVNVIEHIADDGEFLRQAHHVLSPEGTILMFTPAVPAIYGTLDRRFEHHRRYTKAGLAEKLRQAGLRPVCLRYFNLPGVVAWFLAGSVLRRETIRSLEVRFYDRWIVPCESWLERKWEPPLGQSLLAVARKSGAQA
jgi:SAM-dependent methyltransferase